MDLKSEGIVNDFFLPSITAALLILHVIVNSNTTTTSTFSIFYIDLLEQDLFFNPAVSWYIVLNPDAISHVYIARLTFEGTKSSFSIAELMRPQSSCP